MAKTGDRFKMPDGSTYAVISASADTGGDFVEMELTLPAGSLAPPPHIHADLSEDYEILEGSLELMVGGSWRTLAPSDTASVPPWVVHTFRNRSGADVRVRNFHRPAARFEDYIEHIFTLTHARGVKGEKDPRVPVYLAMLMLEYPETLAPGRLRETLPIRALAGLGRLFRLNTRV